MVNDAWMETCLIGISKIEGKEVQFQSLMETTDFDIGDKDIEGVPLVNGGRVTKWNPEADSSITFEAYSLEAGAGEGFFDLLHVDDVIISSTTTSTTSGKLVDTGADFTTLAVAAGDKIRNTTDDTECVVTSIESSTILVVTPDVMEIGEEYILTDSPYRVVNSRTRVKHRVVVLWTDKSSPVKASEAIANNLNAYRIAYVDGYITSVKTSFTDGIAKHTITYKCAAFDKSGDGNVMEESCAAGGGDDTLPAIASYTTSNKFG